MLGQSLDPFSIFGLTRQNWYEGPSKSSFLIDVFLYTLQKIVALVMGSGTKKVVFSPRVSGFWVKK